MKGSTILQSYLLWAISTCSIPSHMSFSSLSRSSEKMSCGRVSAGYKATDHMLQIQPTSYSQQSYFYLLPNPAGRISQVDFFMLIASSASFSKSSDPLSKSCEIILQRLYLSFKAGTEEHLWQWYNLLNLWSVQVKNLTGNLGSVSLHCNDHFNYSRPCEV